MTDTKYTSLSFREKIGNRINSIDRKEKHHFVNIFKIIYSENEKYLQTKKMVNFEVNKCSVETIKKLEKYLDENFPSKDIIPIENVLKNLSESNPDSNLNIKLTNVEKSFLKRIDSSSLKKDSITKKTKDIIPNLQF